MATYNSYFNLDFFLVNNRDINTIFIATTEYEQYVVSFENENISFSSDKSELYSTWTSFFDSPKENFEVNLLHDKLIQLYELTTDLKEITTDSEPTILEKYLNNYKSLTKYHPYFLMYYSKIYSVINAILNKFDDYLEKCNCLLGHLNSLINNYKELYNYVTNVLIEPFQHGLDFGTGYNVIRYERFILNSKKKSPLYNSNSIIGNSWEEELGNMVVDTIFSSLELKEYNATFLCRNDLDYSLEFSRGLQYYIDNDYIFRQCPQCKGFFKTKRQLSISYCNRIYRNNLTCQDIGAKNKYKEKMASHPIHAEFTKVYSRLYARIRRKTLLKENAKLEELKNLHDSYYEKYENSSFESRDNIIQEFIIAMNNLYK